jgi:transposase
LSIATKNCRIKLISENDLLTFKKWRLSSDRRKWEKAVVILDSLKGKTIADIESKIERSRRKINSWLNFYEKKGIEGLQKPIRRINKALIQNIETKKKNLIKLIHETPKNFGINRTSWSLKSLSDAYNQKYFVSISSTMVSEYIRSQGYSFRKAKKVLTSPDPNYREKLQKITNILSNLTEKEKFFSVDEFGPFAIKIQGGRSIVKKGEVKTYPQWQKSKGCLICTAGLELSQNQITHFYSSKKNTDEMLKLLEILLAKYHNDEKIYFSWDAASWHASKKLHNRINEINKKEYRTTNQTPIVELAPLPASAQFLNVIESVFSGMAKAIIHNSNYQSVEDCKIAINRYFSDRNDFFRKFPKRAGRKIWGKESNKPVFDETQNFKDSRWR